MRLRCYGAHDHVAGHVRMQGAEVIVGAGFVVRSAEARAGQQLTLSDSVSMTLTTEAPSLLALALIRCRRHAVRAGRNRYGGNDLACGGVDNAYGVVGQIVDIGFGQRGEGTRCQHRKASEQDSNAARWKTHGLSFGNSRLGRRPGRPIALLPDASRCCSVSNPNRFVDASYSRTSLDLRTCLKTATCDQVSVLHVDMLRTTTHATCAPQGKPHGAVECFGMRGHALADGFGVGWLLMLVFAVGGFAGMVLAALMIMAGGGAARSRPRDLGD